MGLTQVNASSHLGQSYHVGRNIYFHILLELEVQLFTDKNVEKNGQDLGSKMNDHFKVGHYKSLERSNGRRKECRKKTRKRMKSRSIQMKMKMI